MFSAAGCGKEVVVNEYGEETFVYGDLIEISHRDYNTTKRESLVYDKNTKVMYWLFSVSYTHLTLPTNQAGCRSRWSPYH